MFPKTYLRVNQESTVTNIQYWWIFIATLVDFTGNTRTFREILIMVLIRIAKLLYLKVVQLKHKKQKVSFQLKAQTSALLTPSGQTLTPQPIYSIRKYGDIFIHNYTFQSRII